MSSVKSIRYDGQTYGISNRTQFLKETRARWVAIPLDASRHVLVGQTQYDYIAALGPKLTGLPLRLLIQWVDKWDYNNTHHDNNDKAILREVDRQRWRQYYQKRAIFMLHPAQKTTEMLLDAPIGPADATNSVLEPP